MSYPYYSTKILTKSNKLFVIDQDRNKIKRNIFEISRKLGELDISTLSLIDSAVLPIHCDDTLETINVVLKSISQLGNIIDKLSLQLIDIENKYRFSVSLYYTYEQLVSLQSGINELRPICREISKRRFEIQEEIKEQLDQIRDARTFFKRLFTRKDLS